MHYYKSKPQRVTHLPWVCILFFPGQFYGIKDNIDIAIYNFNWTGSIKKREARW